MNGFDRAFTVLGAILGVVLMILGVIGLFAGCSPTSRCRRCSVCSRRSSAAGHLLRSVRVAWRECRRPPGRPRGRRPARGFPLD